MKKFLALSLATVLAAGSVFGLAACDKEKKPDDPDTPNQNQPEKPDKPGTPDKGIKDELLNKLTEFELGQFTFEGNVTGKTQFFSYDQESESVVDELMDVAVKLNGAVTEDGFDLIGTGSLDDVGTVAAVFMRGGDFYISSPDLWEYWEELEIEEGDIDAYLSLFKDGDRYFQRVQMEQMEEMEDVESLVQNPIAPYAARLLMNVCFFGDGKLETTDDGYSLTCDPLESAAALVTSVSNVLSVVSADAKLSVLVSAAPVVTMLDKLFAGISAEELYELYKKNVAEAIPFELPAPEDDSVSAYLAKLVDSEELYSAIVEATAENPFPEAKSFGDITLKQIIGSDEDFTGMLGQIQDILDGFKDKENFLDNLIHLIPGSEDLLSFDANIEYVFDFDKNKELTQIAMNGDLSASGKHAVETSTGIVNKTETIAFTINCIITVEEAELRDLTGMHYYSKDVSELMEFEDTYQVYFQYQKDMENIHSTEALISVKVEANNFITVSMIIEEFDINETKIVDMNEFFDNHYSDLSPCRVFNNKIFTWEEDGETVEIMLYSSTCIYYNSYDGNDDYCYISAGDKIFNLKFKVVISTI